MGCSSLCDTFMNPQLPPEDLAKGGRNYHSRHSLLQVSPAVKAWHQYCQVRGGKRPALHFMAPHEAPGFCGLPSVPSLSRGVSCCAWWWTVSGRPTTKH